MKKNRLIGRIYELGLLEDLFSQKSSSLAVLYGRRRIGKSTLIQEFANEQKSSIFLYIEGLENEGTAKQIKKFIHDLQEQINDPLLKAYEPKSWEEVFDYLTQYFSQTKKKVILCLDEFQWLAANRTLLVSLLKSYWDNQWKKYNVMMVLCGSIASFMVNKVIKSKALYGRIDKEILLEALEPHEARLFFKKKRSDYEILKYLLVCGAVPRYLELINLNKSFAQNMNELFFSKSSFFVDELEKTFFSQFKEAKNYVSIVSHLKDKPMTLTEIAKKLKVKSGGSFQNYLTNLEQASFITSYVPIGAKLNSKLKKYKLSDEFLVFYFKYMKNNLSMIKHSKSSKLFEQLCESKWKPWLGLAFERYIVKNALYIAYKMGFGDKVIDFGPYYKSGKSSTQIDLLYKRSDNVITLCEIKFHEKPISTSVIADIEKKIAAYPLQNNYSLERALITVNGVDQALADSHYLHHILDLKDIFKVA